MEAKVHNHLANFLSQHSLQDSICNIDDIVLSYLLGLLDLIGQGEVEDCFDLEEVMEMMNAYLPGFDCIDRSQVMEWMFSLAASLKNPEEDKSTDVGDEENNSPPPSPEGDGKEKTEEADASPQESQKHVKPHNKFPNYDYNGSHGENEMQDTTDPQSRKTCESCETGTMPVKSQDKSKCSISPPKDHQMQLANQEKQRKKMNSKRKQRFLSCSSQESQDDCPKIEEVDDVEDDQIRALLEMFPAACTMEANHCLHLSQGDMDRAAQLIMDRQDTGQAITQQQSKSKSKPRTRKGLNNYTFDDDSIKSCVLERYSFVDTEEDKKTYRPPPVKNEAKKLVRYRDGQVVSVKGERFSEVKKKDEDDMKPTYVNLKPARKYRFH